MTNTTEARERLGNRAREPDMQWERFDEDNDVHVGACGIVVARDDLLALLTAYAGLEAENEALRIDLRIATYARIRGVDPMAARLEALHKDITALCADLKSMEA